MVATTEILKSNLIATLNTRVVEFLVGYISAERRSLVFDWQASSRREDVSEEAVDLALVLTLSIRVYPKAWDNERLEICPSLDGLDDRYWWLMKWRRVRLMPQLHDMNTMKAAIVDITEAISSKKPQGTTFGILFNILHLCILRISYKDGEQIIEHTEALPFLPSPFTTTPCTESISALTTLTHSMQREILLSTVEQSSPSIPRLDRLPVELHLDIGKHLDMKSLLTFASVSDLSFEGCFLLLQNPYVYGYQLSASRRRKEEVSTQADLVKRLAVPNMGIHCLRTSNGLYSTLYGSYYRDGNATRISPFYQGKSAEDKLYMRRLGKVPVL